MTKCDSQQWKTNSIHETSVKFAGEEAKDRLYEPKHKKKLVRVLTVVAYVFFVSLAAIMLSLYYVFLWNGDQKIAAKYVTSQPKQQRQYLSNKCNSILAGKRIDIKIHTPCIHSISPFICKVVKEKKIWKVGTIFSTDS